MIDVLLDGHCEESLLSKSSKQSSSFPSMGSSTDVKEVKIIDIQNTNIYRELKIMLNVINIQTLLIYFYFPLFCLECRTSENAQCWKFKFLCKELLNFFSKSPSSEVFVYANNYCGRCNK